MKSPGDKWIGSGAKPSAAKSETFAPPTPKVSRQKRAKVLTAAERAAFLATRPDLKKD